MFKKILPFVAFVAVVVFSSFTIAKPTHQKTLDSTVYTVTIGGTVEEALPGDEEECDGGNVLCALVFPNSVTQAQAEYAASHITPGTDTSPKSMTLPDDDHETSVTFYLQPNQ